jgi:hypothetical protein
VSATEVRITNNGYAATSAEELEIAVPASLLHLFDDRKLAERSPNRDLMTIVGW